MANVRRLILIKHAPPAVVEGVPSEQWTLGEKGLAACTPLAEKLRTYLPFDLISSEEPKAAETARAVASQLGITSKTMPNLHEHERRTVPMMRSGEFISNVELFFRKRFSHVLGEESAFEASERFEAAVEDAIEQSSEETLAIVTHGTVLSLFVASDDARRGFELWRKLQLPSFVVMDWPAGEVVEITDRIA